MVVFWVDTFYLGTWTLLGNSGLPVVCWGANIGAPSLCLLVRPLFVHGILWTYSSRFGVHAKSPYDDAKSLFGVSQR